MLNDKNIEFDTFDESDDDFWKYVGIFVCNHIID